MGRNVPGYCLRGMLVWGRILARSHILMQSHILGCIEFAASYYRCLVNNARRGGIPLCLSSRDFAQVPWRQNFPSFISLINLFFSKFMRGCMKGHSLAV